MDPVAAVQSLGGAARWSELAAQGVSRRALARACRLGELVSCGHGGFCLPGSETSNDAAAVRFQSVLSCGAAAEHHGLEVFGAYDLHLVKTSRQRSAAPTRLVIHRRSVDADSRSTVLAQTLLDCARCLPTNQAVSVLDSALRQGRVEPDELVRLIPGSGRHRPKVARVVELTDPASQSVLESGMRVLLVEAGLSPVASQVYVDRVGWVDLVVKGWLVIEVDGYAVHRDKFGEDRRRDAELSCLGFVVLRFTYQDVLRRPSWVLDVVRATLRAGRPPGKPRSAPGA